VVVGLTKTFNWFFKSIKRAFGSFFFSKFY
jgi:hypothetical protein